MKKATITIICLGLLLTSVKVQAQTDVKMSEPDTSAANQSKVFSAVEQDPIFPGGIQAFYRYLSSNIQYPPDAVKNRIQGKVFVTYVVEKDGSLTDVKVIRGLSGSIDEEAVRVIRISPKWSPGKQNGRPVRVQYTIPLSFVLPAALSKADSLNAVASIDSNKTFFPVTQDPSFPGGVEKLYRYLMKNIRYPAKAVENHTEGKVFLTFVVEKNGSLTNMKVFKSVSPELDAEAMRVMTNSPKWEPGRMANGQPARVQYTMPVSFALAN